MSKRKSHKKSKNKQNRIIDEKLQSDVSINNSIDAGHQNSYMIVFFGMIGLFLTVVAIIQEIIDAIVRCKYDGPGWLNVFALFGFIFYFALCWIRAAYAILDKNKALKCYSGSQALMLVSCLCLGISSEVNSIRFDYFSIGSAIVSVVISILTYIYYIYNVSIQVSDQAEDGAHKTSSWLEILIPGILSIVLTGVSFILCIKYGHWFVDEKLIDSMQVYALIELGLSLSVFSFFIFFFAYHKSNTNIKIACINVLYSSALMFFAFLLVVVTEDDNIGLIVSIAYFLAFVGYINASFRYLYELWILFITIVKNIVDSCSKVVASIKTTSSNKPERSLEYVYYTDFELEAEIVKAVYDELIKDEKMTYYKDMNVSFEAVEEYQTRMKLSRRRPFFYNMSSSLLGIYDKKMEQRVKNELLPMIRSKLFIGG